MFTPDRSTPQSAPSLLSALFPGSPARTERREILRTLRMQRPEVLVLSGSVGMGHVKAAENLCKALGATLPDRRLAHLDAVKLMSSGARKLYADGYLSLTEHAPTMLGMAYRMTDSASARSKSAITFDRFLARRLEKLIKELNPEVVVCTHFLSSRVAGHLKATGAFTGKLLQVVTDFDLHQFWLVPQTDHYFVGGAPAAQRLKALGTPQERITLTGIPIGEQFETLPSKASARQELKLDQGKPTILVTLGGAGRAPFGAVLQSLRQLSSNACIVFICGRNEDALKELQNRLADDPLPSHLSARLEGFTKQMHLFMAASDILVGKPGGLTMSETLAAGLVPVLVQPIPGQEEHNSDYLLEEGVALRCRHIEQLHESVERLLQNPEELSARSSRARKLGHPEAGCTIAHVVRDYLSPKRAALESTSENG